MSDTTRPIPPARIASQAGDRSYVPDWDLGKSSVQEAPPQVVPVLQRAGDVGAPALVEGLTIRPAKTMDAAEARNTMARIINDMLIWIDDWPHELTGEEAHVLRVFQELKQRRFARVMARQHDQTIEPDTIDQASFVPIRP